MSIQITKINSVKIGHTQALKRPSIDILLTLPLLVITYIALTKVNQHDFVIVDEIV